MAGLSHKNTKTPEEAYNDYQNDIQLITSRNNKNNSTLLKDNSQPKSFDVESLAFDLGIARSKSLQEYITKQLEIDSSLLESVIKGMEVSATHDEDKSRDAYLGGTQIGKQIKQMAKSLSLEVYAGDSTQQVNPKYILEGLVAGLTHKNIKTPKEAYNDYQKNLQPIVDHNTELRYGKNKKEGEVFLAANKRKEGVVTLPSGLQYKVIKEGKGIIPNDNSIVSFNYTGRLIDGTEFDSSKYEGRQPLELHLSSADFIQGVTDALKLMPQGSVWEVYIPYDQAYGSRPAGQLIKPFSALIFELESIDVTNE